MELKTGEERKSYKRFARPNERPGIRLTEDDYQILWHVYRNRLIESRSLYKLFPERSEQVVSKRLLRLFRTGYLDRPLSQNIKSRLQPGTDPYVYALGREGAGALVRKFEAPISGNGWTSKNANLSVMSIEHHLETSRFVAGLEAAALGHPEVTIRYADELIPPEVAAKRPPGLFNTIRADVPWHEPGHNVGTAPDAIIAIEMDGKRQVLFVEIDRGTETIEPIERQMMSSRFWRDTSFLRKMLIYGAAFRSYTHQQQLGIDTFRVLTVTTKPGRVALMQESYARHLAQGRNKVKPGLFLFTSWPALSEGIDWLTAPYENGVGRRVHLLPDGR